MITLSKNSLIYILAPANSASGGQEALHQLFYYLKRKHYPAKIAYYSQSDKTKSPTIKEYEKYEVDFCHLDEIIDEPQNLVICPEVTTGLLKNFKNVKKAIWWLSVGFYKSNRKNNSLLKLALYSIMLRLVKAREIIKEREQFFSFDDDTIYHLAASQYAYDFLTHQKVGKARLLIEPLGLDFIRNVINGPPIVFDGSERKDRVLYNPAKKSETMRLLIKKYPRYDFVPLKGMSTVQLIETMKTSKVYVDFGKFPGPERLPKEAAICGCCILTGDRGAAKFYEDVRIDREFKIAHQKKMLKLITEKLDLLLNDYDNQINHFSEYRQMVMNLEPNFKKQIDEIFQIDHAAA